MQTTRRSSPPNGRLRNDRSRLTDRATNRQDTALLDVPRSATSAGVGSSVPAYRCVDTPAATAAGVCFVNRVGGRRPLVAWQRHLAGGAHERAVAVR